MATISFRNLVTNQVTGNGGVTINKPAGTVLNDLMICVIDLRQDTSVSAPSGWQTAGSTQGSGGAIIMWVFYKVATATEPANYTFTWTGTFICRGTILTYYNQNITPPVKSPTMNSGTSASPLSAVALAFTPSPLVSGMEFIAVNTQTATSLWTFPGGFNSRQNLSATVPSGICDRLVGKAAVASQSVTCTVTFSRKWNSVHLLIPDIYQTLTYKAQHH